MPKLSYHDWEYIATIYRLGIEAALTELEKHHDPEEARHTLYEAICEAAGVVTQYYEDDETLWVEDDEDHG